MSNIPLSTKAHRAVMTRLKRRPPSTFGREDDDNIFLDEKGTPN